VNPRIRSNIPYGPFGAVPTTGEPEKPKLWTFSFRFWSQLEHFGVPKRPMWYVSVLNRLQQLSKEPIEELQDHLKAEALRYHEIDWSARKIPVQRNDFNTVPPEYRNNVDDYPFVQVHISKAIGRIVGFWDEDDVFNVVVFDPLHNIQPSRKVAYNVRPSPIFHCEYTSLLRDFDRAKNMPCNTADCKLNVAVQKLPTHQSSHEVLVLPFMDGTIKDAEKLIAEGKVKSMSDIFEAGVVSFLDKDAPE
jgi:hypothetical protein